MPRKKPCRRPPHPALTPSEAEPEQGSAAVIGVPAGYDAIIGQLEHIHADLLAVGARLRDIEHLLHVEHQLEDPRTQLAERSALVGGVVGTAREVRSPSPVPPPDVGQDKTPRREGPEEEGPRRSGRKRKMTEKARAAHAQGLYKGYRS